MLDVRLLGQFDVQRDSRRLAIPTRNAQALFAYLLLNAVIPHRRERLAGLFWPDSSEENARSNLRHELWRLRKALEIEGDSYFLADDLTIAFNPHSEYSLDVHRLESKPLEESATDDLIVALSAYHGELLPGFYDEWVFLERDRLVALFEAKITRLLEILQTEGRWAEVLDWGNRWIALGGWPEPAYRALISAYANTGDLSKAVAIYERYAQALQKDLGMKPSEQTQALFKRLKLGWKPDAQSLAPTRVIRSPKSFAEPTSPHSKIRRSNLPKPLTSFIGREKEIQQVERLISSSRLVTITGPGGVGKTRLAIQVAGTLAPLFKDGVRWVELASISGNIPSKAEPESPDIRQDVFSFKDLIVQSIAKVLRVPESPGQPLQEAVIEHIQDKNLLLVLDNCEHLIEACAVLVESLLGGCPDVTILATSREPMRVPGEKAWLLPSLSLPEIGPSSDFKKIFQSEAVSLFLERASDNLLGYQPGETDARMIAQICLRLDGIPLAIELAAARINMLSVQEIDARLDHRFSLLTGGRRTALLRHQTLRAAIEWSYDLLSEAEQVIFRRLSIFTGSFTLEAVEVICSINEIPSEEVLFLIGRLVDKSLLTVRASDQITEFPTRYYLLETIRSFSLEKAEEVDETQLLHDRHAAYYVSLVEAIAPNLYLQDQAHWYKLLQAENDNIHAVVEWSVESDQSEFALRMVGALWFFWWSQSSSHEGCDLTLKALALPSAIEPKAYRARALTTAGCLQWVLGDIVSARQSLEEALSLLRTSDDKASLARVIQIMGLVYTYEREYDLANAAFEEGLAIIETLGDVQGINFLFFQGDIYLQKGDFSQAKKIYEDNLILLRGVGNKVYAAYPLRRLGYLALERNEILQAWDNFRESLTINQEVGDERAVYACLTSLAALAIKLDKPIMAAHIYGAVESGLDSLCINLFYQDQIELERIRSKLRACLDEATFDAAFTEGWKMSEEQVIKLAEESFRVETKI